jgi:hypothetical protein
LEAQGKPEGAKPISEDPTDVRSAGKGGGGLEASTQEGGDEGCECDGGNGEGVSCSGCRPKPAGNGAGQAAGGGRVRRGPWLTSAAHLQADCLGVSARLQQRLHRGVVAQPAGDVQRGDTWSKQEGGGGRRGERATWGHLRAGCHARPVTSAAAKPWKYGFEQGERPPCCSWVQLRGGPFTMCASQRSGGPFTMCASQRSGGAPTHP